MSQPEPASAALAVKRDEVARLLRYGSVLWAPLVVIELVLGLQTFGSFAVRSGIVVLIFLASFAIPKLEERTLDLVLSGLLVAVAGCLAFTARTEPVMQAPALAFLISLPLLCFTVLGNRVLPAVVGGLSAAAAVVWLLTREGSEAGALTRWGTLIASTAVYLVYGFGRLRRMSGLERVQIELEYRALIEALAEGPLVRARTEAEVFESAGRLLRRAKLDTAFLKVDGEVMRLVTTNYAAAHVPGALLDLLKSLQGVALRLDALPWAQQLFANRRAAFRPDISAQLAAALPKSIFSAVFTWMPTKGGLDVPLYADEQPLAMMTVHGPRLTPATAAALELFAHQLETALENVELHERRRRQLEAMTELKQELLEQQRLAGLGEAAAVMAHEVRNPLGVISNAVSLLNRQRPEREESRAVLAMLDEEVTRLDRLVSELLQVARPTALKLEAIDLGALLERCASAARKVPACAGVGIEVHPTAEPLPLRADTTQLEIAVGNLLMNAVQSSGQGTTVRARVEAQPDALCVRVDDTGPGVPAELREKIFTPFFTTRAKGTGLGLTIVRQIAVAHGGEVRVEDAPGGGARFELRLKRAAVS